MLENFAKYSKNNASDEPSNNANPKYLNELFQLGVNHLKECL